MVEISFEIIYALCAELGNGTGVVTKTGFHVPEASAKGRCYGKLDVGLSDVGRRQMERVAQALESKRYKVASVVERGRTQRLGPADFPGIDLERVLANINLRTDLDALGRN